MLCILCFISFVPVLMLWQSLNSYIPTFHSLIGNFSTYNFSIDNNVYVSFEKLEIAGSIHCFTLDIVVDAPDIYCKCYYRHCQGNAILSSRPSPAGSRNYTMPQLCRPLAMKVPRIAREMYQTHFQLASSQPIRNQFRQFSHSQYLGYSSVTLIAKSQF